MSVRRLASVRDTAQTRATHNETDSSTKQEAGLNAKGVRSPRLGNATNKNKTKRRCHLCLCIRFFSAESKLFHVCWATTPDPSIGGRTCQSHAVPMHEDPPRVLCHILAWGRFPLYIEFTKVGGDTLTHDPKRPKSCRRRRLLRSYCSLLAKNINKQPSKKSLQDWFKLSVRSFHSNLSFHSFFEPDPENLRTRVLRA